MDQVIHSSQIAAVSVAAHPMVRLPAIVRTIAADLLCASDTRIIRIGSDADGGWKVEVEVFAPNPELTISMRGGVKAILERTHHRLHFDASLQLVALGPVEE